MADAGTGDAFPVNVNMLESDAPRHTRLRKLVAREFTPRRIEALRPRVQQITDELLDAALPLGRADLIESFAFPLPITVICELLGVPDLDRTAFSAWTRSLIGEGDGYENEAVAATEMTHRHIRHLVVVEQDQPLGVVSLCPAPTANFNSEGGFKPPHDFTWSAAAEEEMTERLNRLLEGRN